jgi:hypothetical protein
MVMATKAAKGMIPKKAVTAVLIKGCENWMSILPGSFDLVEVNFQSEEGDMSGGVLGIKFVSTGKNGRPAQVFVAMESVAGLQIEQAENSSASAASGK